MSSGSLEKCHTGSRWTLQEMQWESFLHWPTNVWECPSSVRLQDLSGWVTLVSSHFRIGCRKEAENQIVRKKIMQTLWRLNGESGAAVHLLPILNLADLEMVLKCLSSNWKCHLCTSGPSSSKHQKILTCSEWRGTSKLRPREWPQISISINMCWMVKIDYTSWHETTTTGMSKHDCESVYNIVSSSCLFMDQRLLSCRHL